MFQPTLLRKSAVLLTLSAILFSNISIFGQKKPAAKPAAGQTAANTTKTAKAECKGNYVGTVTYNRTIKTAYSGNYGSNYDRTYTYQSTITIKDDGRTNGSLSASSNGVTGSFNFTGRAEASMSETVNDLKVSEKDDFCKITLAGAKDKRRVRCESKYIRTGQASGSGDVNVFLGIRGNTYHLSLENPKINGSVSDTGHSSCTGTCGPDQPINSSKEAQINNATERGNYTDEMPLDPNNLNRLSGTFTRNSGDETVTITWNLNRCPVPLEINNVTFAHHRFPDPAAWYGVDPLAGTTDGNLVKVKAKIVNNGGETAYATIKFSETSTGEALPDGSVSVAVKPGESRDVEYEWDTSGYSWDENQKPKSSREIKAEIDGGDTASAKIKILPKPVIMAHGLWSNAAAWAEYPQYLREAHSFAWKGYAVGADPAHGKMNTGDHPGNYEATNTIYQNAQEEAKQIQYTREINNAWHIDLVAHSMGGLISRQYINTFMPPVFDGKPAVTHLVMLGTPNMGSPCADTVNELFEEGGQNDMQAMRELKPVIVRAFNTRVNDRKGVKFSILIGVATPFTCLDDREWGDGVVPVSSAKFNLTDYAYVARTHIQLTGTEDFKGFVLPRIAIGPKKARKESAQAMIFNESENRYAGLTEVSGNPFYAEFFPASYRNSEGDGEPERKPQFKQKIELGPKESREIEIPIESGDFASVVIAAPISVSAVLIDSEGKIAGESKAGPDAFQQMFRSINVKRPITKGTWKLKLENLQDNKATIFTAGFSGKASPKAQKPFEG